MGFHKPYLELNYENLRKFSSDIHWVIINNDKKEIKLLNGDGDVNLHYINGPAFDQSFGPISKSVHHANALKIGLKYSQTPYVLILDPDFIIFHWASLISICENSINLGYDAIGTPWFPVWYQKKVKVFAPHFVYTKKDIFTDNFRWIDNSKSITKVKSSNEKFEKLKKRLAKLNSLILFSKKLIFNRLKIDTDYDTFSGSSEWFGEKNLIVLIAVIKKNQLNSISPHLAFKIGRLIEQLFPKKFRYLQQKYVISKTKSCEHCIKCEIWAFKEELIGAHFRSIGSGKYNNSLQNLETFFCNHIIEKVNF